MSLFVLETENCQSDIRDERAAGMGGGCHTGQPAQEQAEPHPQEPEEEQPQSPMLMVVGWLLVVRW